MSQIKEIKKPDSKKKIFVDSSASKKGSAGGTYDAGNLGNVASQVSNTKLAKKKSGETCQEYWKRTTTRLESNVISRYNSGQVEKARLVKCTCCSRIVPGKTIHWDVVKKPFANYAENEDVPIWTSCEKCHKYLSHFEEDNETKFLGMCIECFKEQGVQK